ncbi:MAG: glycosyltransferase [Paludibacteraceae bacterium]
MNRLLLIGPNFHYFLPSTARAFRTLGWEVKVCPYDNPIHPYNRINTIRYKLAADKQTLKQQSRERYKPWIEQVFVDFQPHVTFIINGDNLLPETVTDFSKHSRVGIWLFDSITRMPDCRPNLPFAHQVFCYEQEDIALLKTHHDIAAAFLPQAVDETLYYPTAAAENKTWDIVFAGDIFHSTKRRQIIQQVVQRYPNKRLRVWGIYKPWFKNPWLWLTRERRDVYTNSNASAATLNQAYNCSRVVLNIHHEQQRNGANPKVYEIAASGAYQICDANPYIEQLFPNGEVGLYHNEQELYTLIDYALTHDMSAHARAAHDIILQHHTFTQRMQQMLALLK